MLATCRAGSQLASDLGLSMGVARTGARRQDPPRQEGQHDREHDGAYEVRQVFVIHEVHASITPQGQAHGHDQCAPTWWYREPPERIPEGPEQPKGLLSGRPSRGP